MIDILFIFTRVALHRFTRETKTMVNVVLRDALAELTSFRT